MSAGVTLSETSSRILDIAEGLVQERGFNAFSYADIAITLGVTKASLHYHFPSKGELGERLIERYRTAFEDRLAAIGESGADTATKLDAYVAIYARVLESNRMCLCGMLASDYATLPEPMRAGVRRFFEANETWLAGLLQHGRDRDELQFEGPPIEVARVLTAGLEGAMLLARSQNDPSRLKRAAAHLLSNLGVRSPVPRQAAD